MYCNPNLIFLVNPMVLYFFFKPCTDLGEIKSRPRAPTPVKHRWIFFMNCRLVEENQKCWNFQLPP
jgi:hypothetical protein